VQRSTIGALWLKIFYILYFSNHKGHKGSLGSAILKTLDNIGKTQFLYFLEQQGAPKKTKRMTRALYRLPTDIRGA
jgi:hypothetical protein